MFHLQVDDTRDETIAAMLQDAQHPVGMDICNTQMYPGLPRAAFVHTVQVQANNSYLIVAF